MTDHKNGNPLDARRENLRVVTAQQNQWNKRPNHKFRVKGVFHNTHENKFIASICKGGKPKYIAQFKDESSAARAYDAKAIEIQGEYARLNFPEGYEHILPDHLIEKLRIAKRGFVKRPEDYL